MAARAVKAWHEANDAMFEAQDRRDEAFVLMCRSGMVANQIAAATTLTRAGVPVIAARLGVELRKVERPIRTSTVIERLSRKGSVLFGD